MNLLTCFLTDDLAVELFLGNHEFIEAFEHFTHRQTLVSYPSVHVHGGLDPKLFNLFLTLLGQLHSFCIGLLFHEVEVLLPYLLHVEVSSI